MTVADIRPYAGVASKHMFLTTVKSGLPVQVRITAIWPGCRPSFDDPGEDPEVEFTLHWANGRELSAAVYRSIPDKDFIRISEECFGHLTEQAENDALETALCRYEDERYG